MKFNFYKIVKFMILIQFFISINLPVNTNSQSINNSFMLSESLGKIVDQYQGKNNKLIYCIQDLHCHIENQVNTSKIIQKIKNYHKDDFNFIGQEGTSGRIDTNLVGYIKDKKIKDKVINKLLKTGDITGPEIYTISNPDQVEIYGIEDRNIYYENFEYLYNSLGLKENIAEFTEIYDLIISRAKEYLFPAKIKNIEKMEKKYSLNKLSTINFINYLEKTAKEYSINLNNYKYITSQLKYQNKQNKISSEKLQFELPRLLSVLKNKIPKSELTYLNKSTNSEFEFYSHLKYLLKRYNFKLSKDFESINAYFILIEIKEKMDYTKLIEEMEDLRYRIKWNMLHGLENGQKVLYCDKLYNLFKKALNLTLTEADRNEWENEKERFIEVFDYVNNLLYRTNYVKDFKKDLNSISENAEGFYKAAVKRNEILASNLIKNLDKFSKTKNKVGVIFAGGFHANGIVELLRGKGISYKLIVPYMSGANNKSEELYQARLAQQVVDEDFKFLNYLIEQQSAQINTLAFESRFKLETLTEQAIEIHINALKKIGVDEDGIRLALRYYAERLGNLIANNAANQRFKDNLKVLNKLLGIEDDVKDIDNFPDAPARAPPSVFAPVPAAVPKVDSETKADTVMIWIDLLDPSQASAFEEKLKTYKPSFIKRMKSSFLLGIYDGDVDQRISKANSIYNNLNEEFSMKMGMDIGTIELGRFGRPEFNPELDMLADPLNTFVKTFKYLKGTRPALALFVGEHLPQNFKNNFKIISGKTFSIGLKKIETPIGIMKTQIVQKSEPIKAIPNTVANATVMQIDLEGSTGFSQELNEKFGSKEVAQAYEEIYWLMDTVSLKYGLHRIRLEGDAYIAGRGEGDALGNKSQGLLPDALALVEAAREMGEKFYEWKKWKLKEFKNLDELKKLELRIGIHTKKKSIEIEDMIAIAGKREEEMKYIPVEKGKVTIHTSNITSDILGDQLMSLLGYSREKVTKTLFGSGPRRKRASNLITSARSYVGKLSENEIRLSNGMVFQLDSVVGKANAVSKDQVYEINSRYAAYAIVEMLSRLPEEFNIDMFIRIIQTLGSKITNYTDTRAVLNAA
ncbi:adenylate/guanylate cyclase domain-containing protein [bacterium]